MIRSSRISERIPARIPARAASPSNGYCRMGVVPVACRHPLRSSWTGAGLAPHASRPRAPVAAPSRRRTLGDPRWLRSSEGSCTAREVAACAEVAVEPGLSGGRSLFSSSSARGRDSGVVVHAAVTRMGPGRAAAAGGVCDEGP